MVDFEIGVSDVEAAWDRIAPHVRRLDVSRSAALSQRLGGEIWLAHEYRQRTGSFKLRGALNAVLQRAATVRGVTTVSTGNHGKALAWSARHAGIRCTVCMASLVPELKREGIRALGAEVRVVGSNQDEAEVEAQRLVAEEGYEMISAFDDRRVICGQGTLAIELLESPVEFETLVVPLSGGGLLSGIALVAKARWPDLRIVGVSMARGAAMHAALEAGRIVAVDEVETLADSLAGGLGDDNRYTFPLVRSLVDEVVLLEEAEIAEAMRVAWQTEGAVLEGGGAVGLGALLAGKTRSKGPTAIVLSGGNIDPARHRAIVEGPVSV